MHNENLIFFEGIFGLASSLLSALTVFASIFVLHLHYLPAYSQPSATLCNFVRRVAIVVYWHRKFFCKQLQQANNMKDHEIKVGLKGADCKNVRPTDIGKNLKTNLLENKIQPLQQKQQQQNKNQEQDKKRQNQQHDQPNETTLYTWQYCAEIFDRLFFWIFFCSNFIIMVVIFAIYPLFKK